ncbi:MAG TPA: hypothetical protein VN837_01440 [Chloroflexota bacterium]|nr:hypothetical protein [Chloroflexota bacterium]
MTEVLGAVEGPGDEAILRRLVEGSGATLSVAHGMLGKDHLLKHLRGYNHAASYSLWVVLVDLDLDDQCAGAFRNRWLPDPAPLMCFRVVVRAAESWLLADRANLSRFLGVSAALLPHNPDAETHPKGMLVDLARRSRFRAIREDMAPRQGSGRQVGPLYTARVIEFARQHWDPDRAGEASDSLQRCLKRLRALVQSPPAHGIDLQPPSVGTSE